MMFVIVEDRMKILAVTDDESVAQEMVLALAEEAIYNSFCEDLCSYSPHRTSVTEIIKSYTRRFRLNVLAGVSITIKSPLLTNLKGN